MTTVCEIAVDAIEIALSRGRRTRPALDELDSHFSELAATFVTLERGSRLLGCVGSLEARRPLAFDVADHALAAAFDDPRVPPVTNDDFAAMSVKVSVLSHACPLPARTFEELRDAIRPGADGVIVEAGPRVRATFLPSVWPKVADAEEFLDALWMKAGLRPRTWPDSLRVARYTTVEFTDPGPRDFRPSPV